MYRRPKTQSKRQLWKINDAKAQKKGLCKSVYWVKEKKDSKHGMLMQEEQSRKMWTQGTTYKGEWDRNRKHGYGIQIWANGNKYEGEWKRGFRHGHGVFWVKERKTGQLRKVYAGNWKKGFQDGLGVYYYPSGDRYEGNWIHGMREGQGTQFFKNGSIYVGQWKEDKQSGFGTFTRANQDIYEGEWLNGKREGPGIHYYKSKEKIYDGEWVNDIPKCGVYCAASEFFQDEAAPAGGLADAKRRFQHPIPRLRLLDPDGVLSKRIEEIQRDRQAVRTMPFLELEKLFTQDGLDDLRRIFSTHDRAGDGLIPATELRILLNELKFGVQDEEIAQLLLDLDKGAKDKVNFSEFVKAAHLMEDLKHTNERKEQEQEEQAMTMAPTQE